MTEILFALCVTFAWAPADNATQYQIEVKDSFPPKEIQFITEPTADYCASHLYEPTTVTVWGMRPKPGGGVEFSQPAAPAVFEWRLWPDSDGDGHIGWIDFAAFVRAVLNPTPEELALFDTDGDGTIGYDPDFKRFRELFKTCISPKGVRSIPCP